MDAVYRGLESSLLAFGLALGLAVAVLASLPMQPVGAQASADHASATLPEIHVTVNGAAE